MFVHSESLLPRGTSLLRYKIAEFFFTLECPNKCDKCEKLSCLSCKDNRIYPPLCSCPDGYFDNTYEC